MRFFPHLAVLFLASLLAGRAADSANFTNAYLREGQLIVAHLASAPFPHPDRADGHKYKEEVFDAATHYSDDSVAIFIPRNYRATGRLDLVVHFHGWRNHVSEVLRQYRLIEQLMASGRNAILVVPQGPYEAADSFGGKLEDKDGFKRFVSDVVSTIGEQAALKTNYLSVGRIILSGHSGGYQVIASILDHGGLTDKVTEVWLFDALYGRGEKFLAWQDQQRGRMLNIYTDSGGTRQRTEEMMAALKKRRVKYLAAEDSAIKADELRQARPVFLHTELLHNDVVAKTETFRLFLETSGLTAR